MHHARLRGREWSASWHSAVDGPLATDPEAARALICAAVERVHMDTSLQLELKPHRQLEETADGLVRSPWRQTFVLDLPRDPERLRFGNGRNHSRIRWSVNKAVKLGRSEEHTSELQSHSDLVCRLLLE